MATDYRFTLPQLAFLAFCFILSLWVGSGETGAALAASASTNAPAPRAKQALTVNIGTLPSSLDPRFAKTKEDRIMANTIFTPLYRSPGGSNGRLVPHLAVGMPIMKNAGLRYDVRLRVARWSDGRPILARDVVFAFNRARHTSPFGSLFSSVVSAKSTGPRTVVFILSQRVPWFGELLSSTVTTPVPTHAVLRNAAKWTWLDRIVVSGPFQPIRGRERSEIKLSPNRYWWGARKTPLQKLTFYAVTHAAASPLFRANRLDVGLADTSVHPSAVHSWTKIPDSRFRSTPSGEGQYLFLNTTNEALANVNVRRAIALAINRHALAEITAEGINLPLTSFLPMGIRGSSTIAPASKRLLGADGTARSSVANDLLYNSGWSPAKKLNLYYANDGPSAAQMVSSIVSDLATVRIIVTAHALPAANFAKAGTSISPISGSVDMVLTNWTPQYSDPEAIHSRFSCAAVLTGSNLSNFCDPAFDSKLAQAQTQNGTSRLETYKELENMLSGEDGAMPAVPLYARFSTMLVQPWVRNFVQYSSGTVDFERIWVTTARPSRP